jgi:hypothetical protein
MKYVAHLVRADVRRFRLLLAMWVLIQIGDAVFRGVRPALAVDPRVAVPIELLATVLFVLRWLGTIVIVPLVVQTHPLVGSDAFWLTRPIPWRALFTSKLLLLGVTLVAVPMVCQGLLMLAFRVRLADAFWVVLQTAVLQSLLVVSLMTLSVTTSNLARFALALGSVLVGVALLLNFLLAVMIRNLPDAPDVSAVTPRTTQSPAPIVTLLLLLSTAAIALLIVQYHTRSRWRSVGAGLTGLAVVVVTALLSPRQPQPLPVPGWSADASALQLIAQSPQGEFRLWDEPSHWGRSAGWRIGGIRARMSGVEKSWITTVRLADSSIAFDDGTRLSTAGNGYHSTIPFQFVEDLPILVAMRQVLAVDRLVGSAHGRYSRGAVPVTGLDGIIVTQDAFDTHSGRTGTYRGQFVVDLDQVQIAAVLPLDVRAEFQDRGFRVVIDQVIPQGRTASIKVRQFTTTSIFDGEAVPVLSFYLRNRGRAEAVAGSKRPSLLAHSTGFGLPLLVGVSYGSGGPGTGFDATADIIQFPEVPPTDKPAVDLNAAWLADAEFVIVRTVPGGSVSRTLEIPGFQIVKASVESGQ